jgi:hypothetical protein
MINGNLKNCEEDIRKIKNDMNFSKATMQGFNNDLSKLKTKLEEFYDNNILYLGRGLDDAGYHGWSKDSIKEMNKVDDEICKKFKELYAVVLCGLGEEI